MKELKCPECGYKNPDIREHGYPLPATCNRCSHIWRVQDLDTKTVDRAHIFNMLEYFWTEKGDITRWASFDRAVVKREFPEILAAWEKHVKAEKAMDEAILMAGLKLSKERK